MIRPEPKYKSLKPILIDNYSIIIECICLNVLELPSTTLQNKYGLASANRYTDTLLWACKICCCCINRHTYCKSHSRSIQTGGAGAGGGGRCQRTSAALAYSKQWTRQFKRWGSNLIGCIGSPVANQLVPLKSISSRWHVKDLLACPAPSFLDWTTI